MTAREQAGATELLSIDTNIEAVAREALEEARRVAERCRNNPGPIVAPQKSIAAA